MLAQGLASVYRVRLIFVCIWDQLLIILIVSADYMFIATNGRSEIDKIQGAIEFWIQNEEPKDNKKDFGDEDQIRLEKWKAMVVREDEDQTRLEEWQAMVIIGFVYNGSFFKHFIRIIRLYNPAQICNIANNSCPEKKFLAQYFWIHGYELYSKVH